ncbi:MAG TPA: hypothetical protein PLL36_01600, partial [Candidatus Hydrogenedentes bacterium]|nr:hypothetical protein [Candidatus Hydrogenedentota bacterium]
MIKDIHTVRPAKQPRPITTLLYITALLRGYPQLIKPEFVNHKIPPSGGPFRRDTPPVSKDAFACIEHVLGLHAREKMRLILTSLRLIWH